MSERENKLDILERLDLRDTWLKKYIGKNAAQFRRELKSLVSFSRDDFNAVARDSNSSPEDYIKLLEIYYKIDAGSYTVDAGAEKPALDKLFIFDHKNGEIQFAPDVEANIGELKNKARKILNRRK